MNARQRTSEQWRAAKRRLGLDEETTRAQVLAMVRAGNWDGNKGKVLCRRTGRMVPKPKPFDPWAKWRRIELGDSPRPRVNGWRGKEAPTYSPSIDRARVTETEGWTEWKGSTPKNYNRATCTVHIVSAGRVLADGLHWRYQVPGGELRTGIMRAPRGWHWSADYLGIKLLRRRDGKDYHPTISDVLAGPRALVSAATETIQRRIAARRRSTKPDGWDEAMLDATLVCREDSYAAGNCAAGTETFARRAFGADDRRYIPARELAEAAARVSGTDIANRVRATIDAAIRRQAAIPRLSVG
jgi:hypothetical protein